MWEQSPWGSLRSLEVVLGLPGGLWGSLGVLGLPGGLWGSLGVLWGSLTLLEGRVLHAVGAIAEVSDEGVDGGPCGVQHPCPDVGSPGGGQCPRIHRELSAHLPQHP